MSADSRVVAWHTDDFATDKSATTYDKVVATRWIAKGWPVTPLVHESLLAEAESRIALKEMAVTTVQAQRDTYRKERDSLQSRLDAVVGLADEWERRVIYDHPDQWSQESDDAYDDGLTTCANELRAALGGECRGDGEERK